MTKAHVLADELRMLQSEAANSFAEEMRLHDYRVEKLQQIEKCKQELRDLAARKEF